MLQQRVAVYVNQRVWVERVGALDVNAQPRATHCSDGIIAVRTGMTGAILLPDPPALNVAALLDAMTSLRHSGSGDVLIWSGSPNLAIDRWLSAHGAREGFEPLWMCRDLRRPLPFSPAVPDVAIRDISPGDLPLLIRETAIPYATAWQIRTTHHLASTRASQGDVRVLVATYGNRIVGRVVVNLAESLIGRTAGIYDLAVHPDHQRRGIGRQLTRAALEAGREASARFATLNSTPMGERMYRAAGFDEVGRGQTWFLPEQTLRRPPSGDTTRFAMLISGGDDIPATMHPHTRAILPNGESPLAYAARFRQLDIARLLLAMGTAPDIAALWQLGLRDEAQAMMRDSQALHARRGPEGATALHLAIRWHDEALLTALLDAGASLHLRDKSYQGDAWGWARTLGNNSALGLLNERFPDDTSGAP